MDTPHELNSRWDAGWNQNGSAESDVQQQQRPTKVLQRGCYAGDKTWYILNEYLAWAVKYFGAEKDARHFWENKRMKPLGNSSS